MTINYYLRKKKIQIYQLLILNIFINLKTEPLFYIDIFFSV